MAEEKPRRKVTINQLRRKAREGEQIVQMAIYDYRSAVIADRLGIDILCVSDTGGMILFGHKSTVTVTFRPLLSHAAPGFHWKSSKVTRMGSREFRIIA